MEISLTVVVCRGQMSTNLELALTKRQIGGPLHPETCHLRLHQGFQSFMAPESARQNSACTNWMESGQHYTVLSKITPDILGSQIRAAGFLW